ncbi:MAG: hypothetical protein IJD57_01870 [Candidatus Gastranaerophilales bacterium]|nr:hypothetical protein [Candidatus Gastranaerophilales bacterium]
MKTKKLIILIIFLLFGFNLAFASQDDSIMNISRIEKTIWGFDYSKDNIQKRLERIENNVFGSTNSKLSTKQRIDKINQTIGIESYEESLKPAYEIAQNEVEQVNYPQIDTLEYQIFNSTYQKENIYKRLERLEKKIFGSTQDGDLALRTDRLKAYIKKDTIAQKPNTGYYYEQPYQMTDDIQQYMGSQNKYDGSDMFIQLAGLEMVLFSKTYSQDPVGLRLNRLERKIFQRDFSSDDDSLRLQRLQAAANAQKTAKLYEANKIQKFTSTGMQLGSILLMILALIL